MINYLFVYGTLMDEYAPPKIAETVKKLKYVGKGFVYGRLYDLSEYPGAILDDSTDKKVFGRVYRLPGEESILQNLDEYEEFFPHQSSPSLFVRKKTVVSLESGRKINCWIYEYNKDITSAQMIESGEYSQVAV